MILRVSPDGAVAPYEQIRSQISAHAASGALPPGTRLPSIRQLAGDLGLAPGTVARAYRELEQEGVVVTRVGRGTAIAEAPAGRVEPTRERVLAEAAAAYAAVVRRLGATRDEAVAALDGDLAGSARGRAAELPGG